MAKRITWEKKTICSECKLSGLKTSKNHEGWYVKCPKCGEVLGGFDSKKEAQKEWVERLPFVDSARFVNGTLIMPSKGYEQALKEGRI